MSKTVIKGYPDIDEAERILVQGEALNPGKWGDHCRVAANCARQIALEAGLNADMAYVMGLLHDIGRRFGVTGKRHAIDGYNFMSSLGYDKVARICLTHSYAVKRLDVSLGKDDLDADEEAFIADYLNSCEYDEYDWLIQVCDSVATAEGPVEMQARMGDVKRRYGSYPQDKWDRHIALGRYFEKRAGKPLLDIIAQEGQ